MLLTIILCRQYYYTKNLSKSIIVTLKYHNKQKNRYIAPPYHVDRDVVYYYKEISLPKYLDYT